MDRAPTACPSDEEHKNKKQKERRKSIAYLVSARIGGCDVDLAVLLKEHRQRNLLHSTLSFPFDLIPSDDEQI